MNKKDRDFIRNYADFLYGLSGNELAILSAIIGYALSQNINAEQMNSLGNFFEAIGQIMLCNGAQEQLKGNRRK